MAERFDGRVQREVLGVTAAGHRDLERLPPGLNPAYHARRQRVLDGRSPEEVVRERLAQDQGLANADCRPPFDPSALPEATLVIEHAEDLSRPDSCGGQLSSLATGVLRHGPQGSGTASASKGAGFLPFIAGSKR